MKHLGQIRPLRPMEWAYPKSLRRHRMLGDKIKLHVIQIGGAHSSDLEKVATSYQVVN